jgi:plasmid stabilization system protein ParE
MAEVIWTEPAIAELDAIADYIAIDNPIAAHRLVARVFKRAEHLTTHPRSGSRLRELGGDRYRQIIEPPCRVVYRVSGDSVFVVHVARTEQRLQLAKLAKRAPMKRGKR